MMMLNPCNLEWCDHPLVCQITEGPKVFPSDGLRNIKVYIWPNHCACPHERPKMVCHYDADFDLRVFNCNRSGKVPFGRISQK